MVVHIIDVIDEIVVLERLWLIDDDEHDLVNIDEQDLDVIDEVDEVDDEDDDIMLLVDESDENIVNYNEMIEVGEVARLDDDEVERDENDEMLHEMDGHVDEHDEIEL